MDIISFLALTLCLLLGACSSARNPLPYADSRPTPLHFGLHVTPENTPIDPPERFVGYHTATDFEIFAHEQDAEVPVTAMCDGEILVSRSAEGYGGVTVHSCVVEGKDVTVLYGHLLPSSLLPKGTTVKTGDRLGVLAPAYTPESGGNRKHLHLAVHEGKEIHLLGYVQEESGLDGYLDPAKVFGF